MSQISSCYWFLSFAELHAVHGDDINGDGVGKVFLSDDIIFIENSDDQVFVYVCMGYSATEVDDLPYQFTGPYRTNYGYSKFIILDLDYSASVAKFDDITSGTNWDLNQNTLDISETFDELKPSHTPAVALLRADAPAVLEESQVMDDTSETDFIEEAGADLEWLSDGVHLGGIPGTGVDPYDLLPNAISPTISDYRTKAGIQGQGSIYLDVAGYGTVTMRVTQINADGTITTLGTATPTHRTDSNYGLALLVPSGDKIVFGDYLYTGSKTEQGRLYIYDIDASYAFVNLLTIESPVPTRNGHIGNIVSIVAVDDTITGVEQIHILTGCIDEIWILSDDDNYATIKQLIDLGRNGFLHAVHGSRNRFVIDYYDDTAGGYVLAFLHYDGTTWILHSAGASSLGYRITWGNWVTESLLLLYDQSISTTVLWSTSGATATLEYTFTKATQGYTTGTTTGLLTENLITLTRHNGTYYLYNVFDVSDPTNPVMLYEYPAPNDTGAYTIWAVQDVANNLRVIHAKVNYDPDNYILTIKGREGTLPSFNEGHYYFYATETSKLELPENIVSIQSAVVSYELPTNSEIRFAISIDGGVTWLTWSTGSSSNIAITSLVDIKTEGSSIVYWDDSINYLDETIDREILCAFSLNRPATVAATECPSISNMVLSYVTDEADYTYTPESRQVEDQRIATGNLYSMSSTYKMHIINPFKTK